MKALFIILVLATSILAQTPSRMQEPKPAPVILQLFDSKYPSRQFTLRADGFFLMEFGKGGGLAHGEVAPIMHDCEIHIEAFSDYYMLTVEGDFCKRTGVVKLRRKYNGRIVDFAIFDKTENVQLTPNRKKVQ